MEKVASFFTNWGLVAPVVADRRGVGRMRAFRTLLPTVSNLPGTTLMCIRMPCFDDPTHCVWDTPGLLPESSPWSADERARGQAPLPMRPEILQISEGQSLVFGHPETVRRVA